MAETFNTINIPICVDLDGTLLRTDSLIEAFLMLVKRNVLDALRVPFWLMRGKAHLKSQIAHRVTLDPATLPYRSSVLKYLEERAKKGREAILVTGCNERIAAPIAQHLGIFSLVLASDDQTNLTGKTKARLLCSRFGEGGFDYIGNDKADLAVWRHCRKAIVVGPNPGLERRVRSVHKEILIDDQGNRPLEILRSLRPHQWLKNLLVLVPLLTSHSAGDISAVEKGLVAFIAFSLCASSAYLLNDLLDLPSDRAHPTKRDRPFASGSLSPAIGLGLAPALLIVAFLVAYELLPPLFLLVLGAYYAATTAYSFWLKRMIVVDVITLAALYTTRVIGGAAAISVNLSFWLLAFSMFFFLSLAMIKRCAELHLLKSADAAPLPGRGYRATDLTALSSLGGSASFLSVLILALYIDSDEVVEMYSFPEALWLLCPLMLYWNSRIWFKVHRGEVNEDPVLFAVRDRTSYIVSVLIIVVMITAMVYSPTPAQ